MSAPVVRAHGSEPPADVYRLSLEADEPAPAYPSLFGPLVSGGDLEDELLAMLRRWHRTYMHELERQHGLELDRFPAPRAYVNSTDVERMPEEGLPAVIVVNRGTFDPPEARGDGRYDVRWRLDVATQVDVQGNRLALRVARLYTLAARAIALQQGARRWQNVSWVAERYDVLDSIDDRTVSIGVTTVDVWIADAVNRHAGPVSPIGPDPIDPTEPPDPESPVWPPAELVDVELRKVPLADDVVPPSAPNPDPEE